MAFCLGPRRSCVILRILFACAVSVFWNAFWYNLGIIPGVSGATLCCPLGARHSYRASIAAKVAMRSRCSFTRENGQRFWSMIFPYKWFRESVFFYEDLDRPWTIRTILFLVVDSPNLPMLRFVRKSTKCRIEYRETPFDLYPDTRPISISTVHLIHLSFTGTYAFAERGREPGEKYVNTRTRNVGRNNKDATEREQRGRRKATRTKESYDSVAESTERLNKGNESPPKNERLYKKCWHS